MIKQFLPCGLRWSGSPYSKPIPGIEDIVEESSESDNTY